ncbi:hypothetical protein [Telluria beijingensis]|uniref:hypothetical protein n=1 Tax=Telluria beijingensis TaxID=3068633 RepID=UPI0027963337|nr:hypothetical protein [Massilia sp. REN29]
MQITITPEQLALMRAMVNPVYAAHMEADCELPGFTIAISFLDPYGTFAVGSCGNSSVELGEVAVQPLQAGWGLTDQVS